MASTNDERTRNFLSTYLQNKPTSETAKLMTYANPDPEKEELRALTGARIHSHENLPSYSFVEVTLLNRVKHTLRNLTTLLELTYSLERKLGLDKPAAARQSDAETWYSLNSKILRGDSDEVRAERVRVEDHNKNHPNEKQESNLTKITKTDINHLRSLIHNELYNEFPSLNDKLYSLMKSAKTSFSYSINDIRIVHMNKNFVKCCLNEIYDSLSEGFDNGIVSGLRDQFVQNWFMYKPKSGRSTEKFAPYAMKLITSVIACIGRSGTAYTKDKKLLSKQKKVAELADLESFQAGVSREVITWCEHLGYTPTEDESKGLDLLNFERIREFWLNAFRRNPLTAVGYLVRVAYVIGCDPFLVFIEQPMDELAAIVYSASDRSDATFERAEKDATKAVEKFIRDRIPDTVSIAESRNLSEELMLENDGYSSERFITSAFKAMSTRNLSKDASARKKLHLEFERMLLEEFGDRMTTINTDAKMEDKSLIISTELYELLEDGDLKESFAHAHSDTNWGYLQKLSMSLLSISKIHNEEGKVVKVTDAEVVVNVSTQINSIVNLVDVYIASKSEGIKDLKKEADKIKKLEKKEKEAEKEASARGVTRGSSSVARNHASPAIGVGRASPYKTAPVVTQGATQRKFGAGLNKIGASSPSMATAASHATSSSTGLRFARSTASKSPKPAGASPALSRSGNASPGMGRAGNVSPKMRTSPGGTVRSPGGTAFKSEPENEDIDDTEF